MRKSFTTNVVVKGLDLLPWKQAMEQQKLKKPYMEKKLKDEKLRYLS